MKTDDFEQSGEDNALPFSEPVNVIRTRACNFKMYNSGKSPIIYCPNCGKNFGRDLTRNSIFSEIAPNH
ncbi:MAG: hypothetical protein A2017_21755 [Lentisphaerae bacterium GWF2_44_16]|nr:MAG: hypothetical protein A2017_21755 [Lentisphaerae bacterium GWF2_44_16]